MGSPGSSSALFAQCPPLGVSKEEECSKIAKYYVTNSRSCCMLLACVIPNINLRFVSPGDRCKQGIALTCLKLDMSKYWNATCDKCERY